MPYTFHVQFGQRQENRKICFRVCVECEVIVTLGQMEILDSRLDIGNKIMVNRLYLNDANTVLVHPAQVPHRQCT